MYAKEDALKEINDAQDAYVSQLVDLINGSDPSISGLREIDFTSPTGTGKTVMVAKLINRLSDCFFVVTTLSRGQLKVQIEKKLQELVHGDNYIVFGLNEFTKTTRLQKEDIESAVAWDRRVIWIRDEGHIATNRWAEILREQAAWIVNFSATNKTNNGIQCNFTHTMMLRTVSQQAGTPEEALDKLLEIKKMHQGIEGYNPCALFRVLHDANLPRIFAACEERGLNYINITDESFDMTDLCEDSNVYDVIINKFKITEGIDLKRCHVIYMDSKPSNEATVVQIIGRARRNALFWRNDIDILSPSMSGLLEETRCCYVFYNVPETEVATNEMGELSYSLCDTVSIEALRPGIAVNVVDGRLPNGLRLLELHERTGDFVVKLDEDLPFNIVNNPYFYKTKTSTRNSHCVEFSMRKFPIKRLYVKPSILDYFTCTKYPKPDWDFDPLKYRFYVLRFLGMQHESSFDFEYWGKLLRVDDKRNLVKETFWSIFQDYNDIKKQIAEWNDHPALPIELEGEAMAFSKWTSPLETLEIREIFKDYSWTSTHLEFVPEFIPYIDRVDCCDYSAMEKINASILKSGRVVRLGTNRYRVAAHPLSTYLISRHAKTFEQFKSIVKSYEGKAIFRMPIEYWREMLKTVHSYSQLDKYDSSIVDADEMNNVLQLGLTKQQIMALSLGQPLIKTYSGKDLEGLKLTWSDRNGNRPWLTQSERSIVRHWFVDKYVAYEKTVNDREIAIIGTDLMKYVKGAYEEDRPVTSKISRYSKFRRFLLERYKETLESVNSQKFNGKNDFDFNKKCNSCLGFCVEYFAKIKLFGDDAYKSFIARAMKEAKAKKPDDIVRVRAAMLIYREEMMACYGPRLAGIIPTFSVKSLIDESFAPFVEKVIELGMKTKDFVLDKLYGGSIPKDCPLYDPDLSVNHISALCDFITQDTILDLKCTSSITERHLLQVLAYHYLSTKRSDLHINRLIVYDAVTGRFVEMSVPSQ